MSESDAELVVLRVRVHTQEREIDALRAENNQLRPLISELQHKLRVAETTPHPDVSKAETVALERGEHG
jgi:cell division protein FtsB